jgi:hypothetical protein
MQYFAIITLSLGDKKVTTTSTLTVPPPATRADIYQHMIDSVAALSGDQRWREAVVLFFSAEPSTLG